MSSNNRTREEHTGRRYGTELTTIGETVEYINAETDLRTATSVSTTKKFSAVLIAPWKEFFTVYFFSPAPFGGIRRFLRAFYSALFVMVREAKEWEHVRHRRPHNGGSSGDKMT